MDDNLRASNKDGGASQPPKRMRRGPYKAYFDSSLPESIIPRTTIRRLNESFVDDEEIGNNIQQIAAALPPNQVDIDDNAFHGGDNEPVHEMGLAGETNPINARVIDLPADEIHRPEPAVLEVANADEDGVPQLGEEMIPSPDPVYPEDNNPEEDHLPPIYVEGRTRVSYVDKYKLNETLHPALPTTKIEAMISILHMGIRHGYTQRFIEDMLKFVNIIVGERVLKTSYYIFGQVFPHPTDIKYHYFCPGCNTYLGEKASFKNETHYTCICKEICDVHSLNCSNYFITFSIRQQVEYKLNSNSVKIIPHLNRQQDILEDVMDSQNYRNLCEPGQPLSNENAISITFNTDGANKFSTSSKGSLWPIQFYINEVHPLRRFKRCNILLAGLWYGKSSPDMQMFCRPFVDELNELLHDGVRHQLEDGTVIVRPVVAFACSVDSIARPKLQCMKQFNGACSCSYCLHPNPPIPSDNNQRHYETRNTYPLRTNVQMRSDMETADSLDQEGKLKKSKKRGEEKDDSVRGVKGYSVFILLKYLDLVWSFVVDYLHNSCEGICEQLFDLFLSTPICKSNPKKKLLSSKKRQILDERLIKICPPHEMSRRPRGTTEKASWKAKDWRAFYLYYALPCLQDILPNEYFEHMKLYVKAMFILLKESISMVELEEAKTLLNSFVIDFESYYGVENCTYNLHLLTHWVLSVLMTGNAWATSNFPFESANGKYLQLITGKNTDGLINHVAKKYLLAQTASTFFNNTLTVSDDVRHFCEQIVDCTYAKNFDDISGVVCIGQPSSWILNDEETLVLQLLGELPDTRNKLNFYTRVIFKQVKYYSRAYSKPKVFNDSCVMLTNGTYAMIHLIFKSRISDDILAMVNPIITLPEYHHILPHIKSCPLDMYEPLKIVKFNTIAKKCVTFCVENLNYVCDMPNNFERD